MEQQVQIKPVSKPQTIEQKVNEKPITEPTSEQKVNEKPTGKKFYKKWWFWLIIALVTFGAIGAYYWFM